MYDINKLYTARYIYKGAVVFEDHGEINIVNNSSSEAYTISKTIFILIYTINTNSINTNSINIHEA